VDKAFLIALIGALAAPVLGYLAAVKKLSGKINTSEASELWAESKAIREDLFKRNEFLRGVLDKCEEKINMLESRIDTLEAKNEALYLENGNLKRMIEEHEKTISELRDQVHDLSAENRALKEENKKLKARVKEIEDASS